MNDNNGHSLQLTHRQMSERTYIKSDHILLIENYLLTTVLGSLQTLSAMTRFISSISLLCFTKFN